MFGVMCLVMAAATILRSMVPHAMGRMWPFGFQDRYDSCGRDGVEGVRVDLVCYKVAQDAGECLECWGIGCNDAVVFVSFACRA